MNKLAGTGVRALVLAGVAGLAACSGKPSLSGTYADESDSDQAFQFSADGTWTMVGGGLGGQYTIDGKSLVLRAGQGGLTMTGEIRGDRIVLADRDVISGAPKSVVLRKK